MDQLDLIKLISEMVKQSIDHNPNFSEWERWWRKYGVEQTVEFAKKCYEQQPRHRIK